MKIRKLELRADFWQINDPEADSAKKGPGFFEFDNFLLGISDSCSSLSGLYISLVEPGLDSYFFKPMPSYSERAYEIFEEALDLCRSNCGL